MPYSPEDIVAYEFRQKTRGYDRDEVDGFLDALADQIEEAAKEHEAVRAQLATVEAELAEARQSESALKRAFITVQEASDRALAEAQEEAARLREEAQRELEELRDRASREAVATQLRAEDEARQLVETAEQQARELVDTAERAAAEEHRRVDELQRLDADHRQRLRDHIEEQRAALEALPDPFAALGSELSPPPAPPARESAADPSWDDAAPPASVSDEPAGGDAGGAPDAAALPDDADRGAADGEGAPGDAVEDHVTDAGQAASLEEEVADLWRLQDDTEAHGEPSGADAATAQDGAAEDHVSGDDAERVATPGEER